MGWDPFGDLTVWIAGKTVNTVTDKDNAKPQSGKTDLCGWAYVKKADYFTQITTTPNRRVFYNQKKGQDQYYDKEDVKYEKIIYVYDKTKNKLIAAHCKVDGTTCGDKDVPTKNITGWQYCDKYDPQYFNRDVPPQTATKKSPAVIKPIRRGLLW